MSETANPADKQKHPRYQTICPGTFYTGDQAVDCEVLNISVGGAKIRLAESVEVASRARLRIARVGEFFGRVAWRDGAILGIDFQDQLRQTASIVEDILNEDVSREEGHHHPRTSVLWSGRLLCQGEATNCRILNISLQGAMIRPEKPFKGGPEVILNIDRSGQFAGSIVWQEGEQLGIEFLEEPEHIVRVLGDAVLQVAALGQKRTSHALAIYARYWGLSGRSRAARCMSAYSQKRTSQALTRLGFPARAWHGSPWHGLPSWLPRRHVPFPGGERLSSPGLWRH